MKSILSFVASIAILVATFISTPSAQAANSKNTAATSSSLISLIPSSIIVEQTATFANGTEVVIYYRRDGNYLEVYSQNDLSNFQMKDLASLTTSNFRIVTSTKGECCYRMTIARARKLFKNMVNRYL